MVYSISGFCNAPYDSDGARMHGRAPMVTNRSARFHPFRRVFRSDILERGGGRQLEFRRASAALGDLASQAAGLVVAGSRIG
jgi:hypothetical protein